MPQTKKPKAAASKGAAARLIDLDVARTARAEVEQEPVIVRFGGDNFELPPEMPVAFALYAQDGQMLKAVGALLGDQLDKFLEKRPSVEDLGVLAEQAGVVYGVTPGESVASPGS